MQAPEHQVKAWQLYYHVKDAKQIQSRWTTGYTTVNYYMKQHEMEWIGEFNPKWINGRSG